MVLSIGSISDFEPYSGAVYAKVAAGGREDAVRAVEAAVAAFSAWAATTPAERVKLPFKAAEIVKHHRAEIAEILALETSSTISFATFQQDLVAATIEQAAGWAYLPKEDVLSNSRGQTALLIWSLISAVPSRREQGTRPPPRTWSQWR